MGEARRCGDESWVGDGDMEYGKIEMWIVLGGVMRS